jgi:signal transduction histidine kinase
VTTSDSVDAALRQIRAALEALTPVLERSQSGEPAALAESAASPPELDPSRIVELERQISIRDEFVATLAHELKSPLTPLLFQIRLIVARLESPTAEPATPEWTLAQVRRLEQHLYRALQTLDRLLDASRLATGRIDLSLEHVDFGQAVHDVVRALEPELAIARCPVRLQVARDVTGYWDRIRLEQVCRNLISNAIRYGAGRPIDIRLEQDDEFATLEVRDHGIGIERQHQDRIFERFERVHPERHHGGFGFGLWVVKNICVALGGTVTVESEPGKGTTFTVVLPRRRHAQTETDAGG